MDSQTVFATLRDALAVLYGKEQDSRVVVADAGLDASQIAFSSRAQTNWHNILTEALHQNRLDALLQVVRATYGDNSALQSVSEQYRRFIEQGGNIEPPAPLAVDLHIGALKLPKPVAWVVLGFIVIGISIIGYIAMNTRAISTAITAPTPTATPAIADCHTVGLCYPGSERNLNCDCHLPQHSGDQQRSPP